MNKKINASGDLDGVVANIAEPRTLYIFLYFAVYILTATCIQMNSSIPPWQDHSPIESFTGTLLWMSSFTSLLIAATLQTKNWKSWFWFALSAILAFVAIDEIFALHEHTVQAVHDDDHLKAIQWTVTAGGIYVIHRIGASSLKARIAFLIGYIMNAFYVTVDFGDGDYFTMPFATLNQLQWAEEFLELFALTAYFIGFLSLYFATRRAMFTRNQ